MSFHIWDEAVGANALICIELQLYIVSKVIAGLIQAGGVGLPKNTSST